VQKAEKVKLFAQVDQLRSASGMTLVAYEAPHRLHATLKELVQCIPEVPIVLAKELTKKWEQFHRGSANELLQAFEDGTLLALGEWVFVAYFKPKARAHLEWKPDTPKHQAQLEVFTQLRKINSLKLAVRLMTLAFPETPRKVWYRIGLCYLDRC